ncbi:ArsR family transcriptional regulator [Nocardioides sp. NPDC127514]|uniref:ArsR/SmtB family transcription factor n=1 Tax=unclassified Nocardioides TaxID=2615069 RepID=UPI00332257DE
MPIYDLFNYCGTMLAGAKTVEHPDARDLELTDVLFAISDAARLGIVQRLASGPLDVARCQPEDDPLPKSTLSHHLKVLRLAGVVQSEPNGRQRTITLRRADLDQRFPGLLDAILSAAGF